MPPVHLISALSLHGERWDWAKLPADHSFEKQRWLSPLASLNAFIGPNNCGKSRMLRALFEFGIPGSGAIANGLPIAEATRIIQERASAVVVPLGSDGRFRRRALDASSELGRAISRLTAAAEGNAAALGMLLQGEGTGAVEAAKLVADQYAALLSEYRRERSRHTEASEGALLVDLHQQAAAMQESLQKSLDGTQFRQDYFRVYIPVLRGLRPLQGGDRFWDRTVADYFEKMRPLLAQPGAEPQSQQFQGLIFTGARMYDTVHKHKNRGAAERRALEAYEQFLGRSFFGGDRVEIVPFASDDTANAVLHVKIGAERERPIYDLGDGLAHVLMLTLPLFLYRDKNLLLFIEEPELFLHPGYQRLLIDALLDAPCKGGSRQVFVATHSQHFMDATLETNRVSIFHCSKELPEGDGEDKVPVTVIRPRSHASVSLLRDLGVKNSSVLLANCTVWVEGVTDRMYLRRYLGLLQEQLAATSRGVRPMMEDVHYAFVEYGGANVTHWSFLDEVEGTRVDRLCGELCLLADDDVPMAGTIKAERYATLQRVLGDRFLRLPCREVENLLTPAVIEAVIGDYEGDAGPTLQPFKQEEYRHEYLGSFIETRVLPNTASSIRRCTTGHPYADRSGTIKDKVVFAMKALQHMTRWEDLSPDARAVTEWVYAFIQKRNT